MAFFLEHEWSLKTKLFRYIEQKITELFSQPVAEEPFRFETELDDLPKEKLKGDTLNVNDATLI